MSRPFEDPEESDIDPMETTDFGVPRQFFALRDYHPPLPDEVSEWDEPGRLWEFLYAMAALRYFLTGQTNHLADKELYAWLHDDWLDGYTPELLPAAGTYCHIDVRSGGVPEGDHLWLRYYANEEEREQMARDYPELPMPPSETPPHDRDRYLPEPPGPPAEMDWGFLADDDDDDEEDEDDPLGLRSVDRAIKADQIERQKEAALSASGNWQRPVDKMARGGFTPVPPDELTEEAVAPALWVLLHQLACRGFYVLNTDHLTDSEMYNKLWRYGIREDAILVGRSRNGGWFHDMIGSGSDEDTAIWLRYFANEEQREDYQQRNPLEDLPPGEPKLANRDWRLPKSPMG